MDDRFPDDCTAGLADFSHVDVIYQFDRVGDDDVHSGARHPRNRVDCPLVGLRTQVRQPQWSHELMTRYWQ